MKKALTYIYYGFWAIFFSIVIIGGIYYDSTKPSCEERCGKNASCILECYGE